MGKIEGRFRPIIQTGKSFYAFLAAQLAVIVWFLYAWWYRTDYGLGVTGMNERVTWGIFVSNFIFKIGISHAGIAISAGVRLLKLEAYRPVARMAELLTVTALVNSLLSLVFDLGRQDRMLYMILYGRIGSPLIWDVIAMTTYLTASITYLYLGMREDIALCSEKLPKWNRFYKFLAMGYTDTPESRAFNKKLLWWLALVILPIMITVHTVIAYVYGLMPAVPGWYNPFFGPYFVTAAIASGISMLIVVAAVVRRFLNLEEYIKPDIFRGLANFLRVVVIIYLYFMISEQVTIMYAGPEAELAVSWAILYGEFALLYWGVVILGLVVPFFLMVIPKTRGIRGTVVASLLITIGLWVKRYLIIVPPLTRPRLPYSWGVYFPTWVEWSMFTGAYMVMVLIWALFIKLFPIVEPPIEESQEQ